MGIILGAVCFLLILTILVALIAIIARSGEAQAPLAEVEQRFQRLVWALYGVEFLSSFIGAIVGTYWAVRKGYEGARTIGIFGPLLPGIMLAILSATRVTDLKTLLPGAVFMILGVVAGAWLTNTRMRRSAAKKQKA
jgi:hypothetical protein